MILCRITASGNAMICPCIREIALAAELDIMLELPSERARVTFFWFDLETFGRNPKYDRIAQFAGVRTDEDLRIVEEPVMLYGKLSPDYLPDIDACLITGITPQIANREGIPEAELVEKIDNYLSVPNTCAVGYNSIAFDDEFIRNLYYRNLRNPYTREWKNGNSRWDLIDLTRAVRDLRPGNMNWPPKEKGHVSVRLELLTKANGIDHGNSHDALSDVYATIGLARLLKKRQPRLFDWALRHRGKEAIRGLVEKADGAPLIYTGYANFGGRGNTGLIYPISYSPTQPNTFYAFDLSADPQPLLDLEVEAVYRLAFPSQLESNEIDTDRIPLRRIITSKCPFLAPMSELTDRAAQRLGIDFHLAVDRCQRLRKNDGLSEKVLNVFLRQREEDQTAKKTDADFRIYEGFFPNEDWQALELISKKSPKELKKLEYHFKDVRIPKMIRRYIRRNFPELLNAEELRQWREFCFSRLKNPPLTGVSDLNSFKAQLAKRKTEVNPSALKILQELEDYAEHLETVIQIPFE